LCRSGNVTAVGDDRRTQAWRGGAATPAHPARHGHAGHATTTAIAAPATATINTAVAVSITATLSGATFTGGTITDRVFGPQN